MKGIDIQFCIGVGIILFWCVLACFSVGKVPKNPLEPHPWYTPLIVFLLLVPPFLCGLASKVTWFKVF